MKRRFLAILLMCLLLFSLFSCGNSERVSESVKDKKISMQSECNIALINTYLKNIQDASDDFYQEYFTISPTVAYYYVWVKKINVDSSTNPTSSITFICWPFVGPHDTVGIDEISFSADYTGNIELKEFKHIKSYSLPDNLKGLVKKPIPGDYEEL